MRDTRLPRQLRQKATYAELIAIALSIILLGLDYCKGYLLMRWEHAHLFPPGLDALGLSCPATTLVPQRAVSS